MMSESRRNRRNRRKSERNKHQPKSDITKKDRFIGLLSIIIIIVLAAVTAYFYSLSKAGLKLF
jgi:hypothetical protein